MALRLSLLSGVRERERERRRGVLHAQLGGGEGGGSLTLSCIRFKMCYYPLEAVFTESGVRERVCVGVCVCACVCVCERD